MNWLDQQIQAWVQSVAAKGALGDAGADELADHLYCMVDSYTARGMSVEKAFAAAVERLGSREDLEVEFAKNRELLDRLCAQPGEPSINSEAQRRSSMKKRSLIWLTIGYVSLLAIMMLVALRFWGGRDDFEAIAFILYSVWMVPYFMFLSKERSAREEIACLRRNVVRLIRRGE